MVTTSSDRGFQVPTVGGDTGTWGTELNTTIASLDSILGGTITLQSTTTTNATPTSSQAQIARFIYNNTSSSPVQLNLPSSVFALGEFKVQYNSSQGQNLTITAGSSGTGGSTVTMPSGAQRSVFSDGVNVTFTDQQVSFPIPAGVEFAADGGTLPVSSGFKAGLVMPFGFTVQEWNVTSWDSSNANYTFDIQKSSFPGANFASITGSCQPNLVNATSKQDSTLSGWTTTLNSGDLIRPILNSPSSVGTKVTLALIGQRTN